MIMKEWPRCPICGGYAEAIECDGIARVSCENNGQKNGNIHYVTVGGETMEQAKNKWCTRFIGSYNKTPEFVYVDDLRFMYMK